ncbi:hypothetical protein CLV72_103580 [Allonocardiopsis opalescens]|uniref:Uncharacterized protein n=1 Tax=Allonocardiopsis opalescens TaxID=1144618 RepID=A0A2T0Q824_9ACTN|nr:hypothetical protein CLV72_103580 [Allonocardiopsis opalescens]
MGGGRVAPGGALAGGHRAGSATVRAGAGSAVAICVERGRADRAAARSALAFGVRRGNRGTAARPGLRPVGVRWSHRRVGAVLAPGGRGPGTGRCTVAVLVLAGRARRGGRRRPGGVRPAEGRARRLGAVRRGLRAVRAGAPVGGLAEALGAVVLGGRLAQRQPERPARRLGPHHLAGAAGIGQPGAGPPAAEPGRHGAAPGRRARIVVATGAALRACSAVMPAHRRNLPPTADAVLSTRSTRGLLGSPAPRTRPANAPRGRSPHPPRNGCAVTPCRRSPATCRMRARSRH